MNIVLGKFIVDAKIGIGGGKESRRIRHDRHAASIMQCNARQCKQCNGRRGGIGRIGLMRGFRGLRI
jgi:hypothetical protein